MSSTGKTHPSFLLRLRDRADRLGWPDFQQRYSHMLYRYARARGASHNDAEDIVQQVVMQFFQAIDGFEYDARKGRFRAYLRAAVVRAMGRQASRQARQPVQLDPHTFDHIAAQRETASDEQWEAEWRLHRLRWAVREIAHEFDPTTLKAFEIHVLAGQSVSETADALGISKWRVYRARDRVLRRLKQTLSELDPDGDA